jgi:hypothetical protein
VKEGKLSFNSDPPLQTNQLSRSIDFPPVDKAEFLEVLTLDRKRIVDSVNTKEGALYLLNENASFKQYFTLDDPQTNRNGYRKTFDMVDLNGGPIAGLATVSQPHGITGLDSTIIIYAGVTSPAAGVFNYFSVMYPYAYLTPTNVVFVNPIGTVVTKCYLVAEYLKN